MWLDDLKLDINVPCLSWYWFYELSHLLVWFRVPKIMSTQAPTFTQPLQNVVALEGSAATFQAQVSGEYPTGILQFYWPMNGYKCKMFSLNKLSSNLVSVKGEFSCYSYWLGVRLWAFVKHLQGPLQHRAVSLFKLYINLLIIVLPNTVRCCSLSSLWRKNQEKLLCLLAQLIRCLVPLQVLQYLRWAGSVMVRFFLLPLFPAFRSHSATAALFWRSLQWASCTVEGIQWGPPMVLDKRQALLSSWSQVTAHTAHLNN